MSRDVTASTLTSYSVSVGSGDENFQTALELAKDCIKGHLEDYYFFQYDDDEYVLLLSYDMQAFDSSNDCSAYDVTAIVFWRDDVSVPVSRSVSLQGTITEVGATPSVDDVLLSGSVSDDPAISSTWHVSNFSVDSLHVYNTSYICYSSVGDYYPKISEGVTYYAYAAFVLCFGVVAFKLVDRIFRRVY